MRRSPLSVTGSLSPRIVIKSTQGQVRSLLGNSSHARGQTGKFPTWPRCSAKFSLSSTVRTLHVSQELAGHVALAPEDITREIVTEVLPSLVLIRVVGQPASTIEKFVAGRRLYSHPVVVIDTETEFYSSPPPAIKIMHTLSLNVSRLNGSNHPSVSLRRRYTQTITHCHDTYIYLHDRNPKF